MKCSNCNQEMGNDALKFCPHCGHPIEAFDQQIKEETPVSEQSTPKITFSNEGPNKQSSSQYKQSMPHEPSSQYKQSMPHEPSSQYRQSMPYESSSRYVHPAPAEPVKKKKNIVLPICIACMLLGMAGIGFGAASIFFNSDNTVETKTEETADKDSGRDRDEKEESYHEKKEDVSAESDVTAASVEASEESSEDTTAEEKKKEEEKEEKEEKKKEDKKEEDQQPVAFIPEEEPEETKPAAENQSSTKPSSGSQSSGSQSSGSQSSGSQSSGSQSSGSQSSGSQSSGSQSSSSTSSGSTSSNYGTYKLVNTDYLTLRSSASITNKNNKILQIPANSELTVLETGCNGYWKVDYKGTVGYVLPSYLAPCSGAKTISKKGEYQIITDYVTLRDIPSTDGEARATITTGAVVEYYDTADNGFILVSYNGTLGYILTYYGGETLVKKIS